MTQVRLRCVKSIFTNWRQFVMNFNPMCDLGRLIHPIPSPCPSPTSTNDQNRKPLPILIDTVPVPAIRYFPRFAPGRSSSIDKRTARPCNITPRLGNAVGQGGARCLHMSLFEQPP